MPLPICPRTVSTTARAAQAAARSSPPSAAPKRPLAKHAATALEERSAEILAANERDLAGAVAAGLTPAQLDRLR